MQLTPNPQSGAPPFRLQTGPGEAFAHPSWQAVRDEALAAIARGESVSILGQPGTGKTLLLQSLAQAVRAKGNRARLLGYGETVPDEADCDLLLVDEDAQAGAVLGRLYRLPIPFVLAGWPTSAPLLVSPARRIETLQLEPLSPEEVARFVAGRLSATGRPRDTFEADAVFALARHSGGLMRLVIVLASAALFFAEQEGAARVARHHVDEAAAMREVHEEAPTPDGPVSAARPIAAPTAEPAEAELVEVAEPPPHVPVRSNRVWALGGAAAGLIGMALAIVAGWSLAGRPTTPTAQPMPAPVAERSPQAAVSPAAPFPAQMAQIRPPDPAPAQPAATERRARPPRQPVPLPADSATEAADLAFRGPIMNETMGQGGQLALAIRSRGAPGPVTAHFHAYAGLIGSGELTGAMSPDGRLSLAGRLMMGRNPFDCTLDGTLEGGRLSGSATFTRAGGGSSARSVFTLSRS